MFHPAIGRMSAAALGLSVLATLSLAGCKGPAAGPDLIESQNNLDRAVALLQTKFRSTDPDVRANSLESLEPLHEKRVTGMLEQGLHDPRTVVRFTAAMVAGKQANMDLRPALRDLFNKETNASVQVALVYAMKRTGVATDSDVSLLGRRINSPDPEVRANTALVLGMLGNPTAVELLNHAKRDPDPRVKLEVTAALARLGDEDAEMAIMAMSINRFAEYYYTAIQTAADIPNKEVRNVLVQGLKLKDSLNDAKTPPTPEQKLIVDRGSLLAARSLGKLGDKQGAELAFSYLHDPEPQLRALACLALGEVMNPRGEHHMVAMFNDPDERVQVAAAAAVVNIVAHDRAIADVAATQPNGPPPAQTK